MRIATAAVVAPAAVAFIIAGGPWLGGLIVAIGTLCVWELSDLQRDSERRFFLAVALPSAWAFPIAASVGSPAIGWLALSASVVGGMGLIAATRFGDAAGDLTPGSGDAGHGQALGLGGWGLAVAGGLYVGTLLTAGVLLRERPDGLAWTTLVVGGTWACDTLAFLVGRQWGRHRFAVALSPSKTLEGSISGIGAAILVAAVGGLLWALPFPRALGLGVVVGLAGVVGDLMESALKRQLGAKDSGWILPGHGGMLDRIDSLLVAIFLGYLYVSATEALGWP